MKAGTLVLPEAMADELATIAKNRLETAGVILAGLARSARSIRILGVELHAIGEDGYDIREDDRLSIPSRSYIRSLAEAERRGLSAIFFHTHPGDDAVALPSRWDDVVDADLTDTFRVRTGSAVYGSLVLSPGDAYFTFSGRGVDGDEPLDISRAVVVGDRMALLHGYGLSRGYSQASLFDRNVRAFGSAVQATLGQLRIGIVGCGGTGSAVAEQLIRLGARSMLLVDPDVISESNVSRVYGSTLSDVGRGKTDVLEGHLSAIAPDAAIHGLNGSVLEQSVVQELVACDVLFGCTDDNAGRLILTRVASYYLIPLIDCGVLISSNHEAIESIFGRVTVQTPGAACLVCRGRIDLARASAEQLPEAERNQLQREGYAPELGMIEPAVVAFTTAVAAQAVTELLDCLIGFGPDPRPTEILLRLHDREVSGNRFMPTVGHFCNPNSKVLGSGDREPFLGLLWRA